MSDRKLSEEYFELNPVTFHLSTGGLARFNRLCIVDEKPINNPRDFRVFAEIFKNGTEYEVALVETNEVLLSDVLSRLNGRREQREFLNQLETIRTQLGSLVPAGFRGTRAEIETIRSIKTLVDEKLYRLAKHA